MTQVMCHSGMMKSMQIMEPFKMVYQKHNKKKMFICINTSFMGGRCYGTFLCIILISCFWIMAFSLLHGLAIITNPLIPPSFTSSMRISLLHSLLVTFC